MVHSQRKNHVPGVTPLGPLHQVAAKLERMVKLLLSESWQIWQQRFSQQNQGGTAWSYKMTVTYIDKQFHEKHGRIIDTKISMDPATVTEKFRLTLESTLTFLERCDWRKIQAQHLFVLRHLFKALVNPRGLGGKNVTRTRKMSRLGGSGIKRQTVGAWGCLILSRLNA